MDEIGTPLLPSVRWKVAPASNVALPLIAICPASPHRLVNCRPVEPDEKCEGSETDYLTRTS
jgi:hypothetical protein